MLTLSLISLAYNEEAGIVPFLESVAAQTWPDFEFVIVDDGSTDRTAERIAAYLPRLGRPACLIRHEANRGQRAAVAAAFAQARGDICLKVDSDCLLEPHTLARVMETLAADAEVGVVTALVKARDGSSRLARGEEVLCVARQRHDRRADDTTTTAYGSCFAFRRSIFTVEELATRWDVDLSELARERGWKIALLQDVAVRTRFSKTLREAFARGQRMAHQELPALRQHQKLLLTRWGVWIKFAPLGLILTAAFKPRWALAGLLGWLAASQVFLACRAPDYPLADRLAGWGVTVVRWSGFDLEVLGMATRAIAARLGHGKGHGRVPMRVVPGPGV